MHAWKCVSMLKLILDLNVCQKRRILCWSGTKHMEWKIEIQTKSRFTAQSGCTANVQLFTLIAISLQDSPLMSLNSRREICLSALIVELCHESAALFEKNIKKCYQVRMVSVTDHGVCVFSCFMIIHVTRTYFHLEYRNAFVLNKPVPSTCMPLNCIP